MGKICYVLHYGEIGLKLGNRDLFEHALRTSLEKNMKGIKDIRFKKFLGRIVIFLENEKEREKVEQRILCTPGIVYYGKGYYFKEVDEKKIAEKILECKDVFSDAKTFSVVVKRTDKLLEKTSPEYGRDIGACLLKLGIDKKVKLTNPDLPIFVEIFPGGVIVFFEKKKAVGGLPIGSGGKVVSLLSAGFDSPVASYYMMKRGQRNIFVHFHSYPQVGKESIENVKEIVEILSRYQGESTLYLVPLISFQKEVLLKSDPQYRVILYRRMMLRIAQKIAFRVKALGLVTGESIGQVASQTLRNIYTTNQAIDIPVYRPLCGMDKREIIDKAGEIGTQEICSRRFDDCCTLFIPKSPALYSKLPLVEEEEKKLDIEKYVKELVEESEKIKIPAKWD